MIDSLLLKKNEVQDAINFIRKVTNFRPQLALILGSGLDSFGDRIDSISTVSSIEIPCYLISSVQGHAGKLIFGYLQKDIHHLKPLLVFQGRVHFYETGSLDGVVFPILLSHRLGIKKLIITNAAGGINSYFNIGDLMLVQDILNLSGIQLRTIPNDSAVPNQKYPDYFDTKMKQSVIQCASRIKIPLQQGTYCWLRGPSYETPAEIQMLKRIGVDAVGMSTVPEVFLARRLGMKTVGISLISNLAAGISSVKLSHADVLKTGTKVTGRFSELIEQLVLSLKQ
jgi:purine-nucleoside phosphorylase